MKVLLIDVYNYVKGGAETVNFTTAAILRQHGHEAVPFALKWADNLPSPYSAYFAESKESRKGPLSIFPKAVAYFYNADAARRIERLIEDERPDIAHIHLMWGQVTPSIFPVLRRHGIPVVYTVHDYRLVCPAYTFKDNAGRICERCRGRAFYHCLLHNCCKGSRLQSLVMTAEMYFRNAFFHPARNIDGFIYVSDFARSIQERYMPLATDLPSMRLYNCTSSFADTPKTARPSDPYFLYFGRLSHEKGITVLIDALASTPGIRLKIAGTGPLDAMLRQRVAEAGMADRVEFLGFKTGRELTDLIAGAYFVVVPSVWYENNPMTIIEAYAQATPVIGSRIGGIPEIIVDGTTGYQAEAFSADDLAACLRRASQLTSEGYAAMSAEALRFAKLNFSPEQYYPKLIDFYTKIIDKGKQ